MFDHVCEFTRAAARDVPASVAGCVCRLDLIMLRTNQIAIAVKSYMFDGSGEIKKHAVGNGFRKLALQRISMNT